MSPGLLDCDNITTKTLIEDGPVIAAEELENFSSFNSGKRRSRIVVISDPTIIEGKCVHYRNNAIGDNQKFIRSLYLPSPDEYQSEMRQQSKVKLTDLLSRMNEEKKIERNRNLALSVAAVSAVTVFGIILTL